MQNPMLISGPNSMIDRWKTFSLCKTKSRCASSAPSSLASGKPRSIGSSVKDQKRSLPMISCFAHSSLSFAGMPAEAAKAIALLEEALKLEPDYSAAHAYLSWCFHSRFSRGGLREEDRLAAVVMPAKQLRSVMMTRRRLRLRLLSSHTTGMRSAPH